MGVLQDGILGKLTLRRDLKEVRKWVSEERDTESTGPEAGEHMAYSGTCQEDCMAGHKRSGERKWYESRLERLGELCRAL